MRGRTGNQVAKPLSTRTPSMRALAAKLLALALLLGLAALALPQGRGQDVDTPQVADVIPRGLRTIGADRVMTYIKTRTGSDLSQSQLKDDLVRLYDTKLFKDVRPVIKHLPDGRVNVYFDFQELPSVVQEVIYRNAGHIKPKDLEEMSRVRKGAPLDPTTNKNACNAIQDALKKQGRYFATVTLEEGGQPTDKRVIFNITEGPKVRVRHVNFTGHDELATSGRLRTQTDTKRSLFGLIGGTYNAAIPENDVLKLEDYYKANGYMDVRVTRELKFTDDYQEVDIVFHIHEGQKYQVEDVVVLGHRADEAGANPDATAVAQGRLLQRRRGHRRPAQHHRLLRLARLSKWRPRRKSFFRAARRGEGRLRSQGKAAGQGRPGHHRRQRRHPGPRHSPRRRPLSRPDSALSRAAHRREQPGPAQASSRPIRKRASGRPSRCSTPTTARSRTSWSTCRRRTTGSLMFGAGVNSDAGLVGSIVLNETQLRHLPPADQLRRHLRRPGLPRRRPGVPHRGRPRHAAAALHASASASRSCSTGRTASTTSGYYYDRLYNEYTEDRFGGRVTLGHQFNRELERQRRRSASRTSTSAMSPVGAPVDYTSVHRQQLPRRPARRRHLRHPRFVPAAHRRRHRRRLLRAGLRRLHLPASSTSRAAGTSRSSSGPTAAASTCWPSRSQFGWAGANTPVYERFFAGGFQSMRGFEFRGVGPDVNGFNVGGDFMFLNSLEYQIPDPGQRSTLRRRLRRFRHGRKQRRHPATTASPPASASASTVPMLGPVPIALDFGFPIVTAAGDRTQVFSFWVGLFR